MPMYTVAIANQHESIVRPMAKSITDEIIKIFGFNEATTQFVFMGMGEDIPNTNSTLQETDADIRTNLQNRVEISWSETDTNPLQVTLVTPMDKLIFDDKDTKIWLKPNYTRNELTLNFKMIVPDRTTAMHWQETARVRSYRDRHSFQFSLDYHYAVPIGFLNQLKVLHTLRENSQEPLGEDFPKWLSRCFDDRMTVVSNQAGNNKTISIAEKLTDVGAEFTYAHDITEIEKSDDAGSWQFEFEVFLIYQRIHSVTMGYPIMVHSTMIPKKYRDDTPMKPKLIPKHGNKIQYHLTQILPEPTRNIESSRYPAFDDWIGWKYYNNYLLTLSVLCQVELNNPRHLLNLHDLDGDYKIPDDILNYMSDVGSDLSVLHESLYMVSRYEWDTVRSQKSLMIDRQLNINTTVDLDLKVNNRVTINILTDWFALSEKARKKISYHPTVLTKWLWVVYPGLPIDWMSPFLPKQPSGGGGIKYPKPTIVPPTVVDKNLLKHGVKPKPGTHVRPSIPGLNTYTTKTVGTFIVDDRG